MKSVVRDFQAASKMTLPNDNGQVLELEQFGDSSGYLQPGITPEEISEEVVGGAVNFVGVGDATVISGNYDPYDLSWTKKDVISKYFSPR